MTHSYVILDVSKAAYAEIAAKLKAAGYDHAFHEKGDRDGDEVLIDMHGIALREEIGKQRVLADLVLNTRTLHGVIRALRSDADGNWTSAAMDSITLDEICNRSAGFYTGQFNFGKHSLAQLRRALAKHGRKLKDDDVSWPESDMQ